MKVIVILTDAADGSVNIEYLHEMTTEEALNGADPEQSPSYQCAATFNAVVANAKALVAEMRNMHVAAAEKEAGSESGKCWH